MTPEQTKEFVELCGRILATGPKQSPIIETQFGNIYHLGQLVEMLGERLSMLRRPLFSDMQKWECEVFLMDGKGMYGMKSYYGSTPEIACAKAIIELQKEGKDE